MFIKNNKKIILTILSLIFIGKLVHSLYNEFFVFPEEKLLEIRGKTDNYLILKHDKIHDWKQKFSFEPSKIHKVLENHYVIEEFLYTNLENRNLISFSLENFDPLAYKLKLNLEEPFAFRVYFYKKIISFPLIIDLLSNAFLWTFFLVGLLVSIFAILYVLLYLMYRVKETSKLLIEKKLIKNSNE
ncbi:MAG: hypothetical protein ACK4UJ_03560 [Leptonema sp. (in: bacteria)]